MIIRDVRNLFDLSVDKDYYKPIITNSSFDNSYIEYESKGGKDKTLSFNKYLYMIRSYYSDIINNYKIQGEWKIHSGDTVINYQTQ